MEEDKKKGNKIIVFLIILICAGVAYYIFVNSGIKKEDSYIYVLEENAETVEINANHDDVIIRTYETDGEFYKINIAMVFFERSIKEYYLGSTEAKEFTAQYIDEREWYQKIITKKQTIEVLIPEEYEGEINVSTTGDVEMEVDEKFDTDKIHIEGNEK